MLCRNIFRFSERAISGFQVCCHRRLSGFEGITVASVKAEFIKYEGGSVKLDKNDESGIATITLCHHEKKNAISGKMMCQFSDIVTDLEEWSAQGLGRAVLLKSDDKDFFCSGADLTSTVRKINHSVGGFKLATIMHDTVTRLANLPLISVALVRGRAIGGGAELTLSTDFRAFAPTGRVNFVQARLGVLPGWAGGSRLVNLVGRNKAMELLLTCRGVDAKEAFQLGLCDKILDTGSTAEAEEWINSLISHDRKVTSLVKELCTKATMSDYSQSLDHEKRLFASVWGGDANRRALEGKIKH